MKRKKIAVILSCLALSGAVLAGCGSNTQSAQSTITQDNQAGGGQTEASEKDMPEGAGQNQDSSDGSTTAYGKVTKVDGNKITYTLGELQMPEKGERPDQQNQEDQTATSPQENSQNGDTQNEQNNDSQSGQNNNDQNGQNSDTQNGNEQNSQKPDGNPGQMPNGNPGERPDGNSGQMPDLSENLTLTDETNTIEVDSSIDISGIAKDDYVTITLDKDGKVTAVEEGVHPGRGMGAPGGKGPQGNPQDSSQQNDSSQNSESQSDANQSTDKQSTDTQDSDKSE